MNKLKQSLFIVAMLFAITLTILTFSMTSNSSANSCTKKNTIVHQVIIKNGVVSPEKTHGTLCDKMTITNLDPVTREVAFGPHEHHEAYDGVLDKFLNIHQSLTVTFDVAGTFHFHDHLHDSANGYFTVANR